MSFDHRLENNNPYELTHTQLEESIRSMTLRAESVLIMLESEFIMNNGDRLTDEIIFGVLNSVRMEVLDIRSTVSNYHDFQRQQMELENHDEQ